MPAAVVLQQDKRTGRACGWRRENDVHLRQWNWTGMSPAATWNQTAVSAGLGIAPELPKHANPWAPGSGPEGLGGQEPTHWTCCPFTFLPPISSGG